MKIDEQNYRVVWREAPIGLGSAAEPGLRAMPYLVRREAYAKGVAVFDEEAMLHGVLHASMEAEKRWRPRSGAAFERFLERVLGRLREALGFESLEVMVLSASARVRDRHGRLPAMKMLMTGHRLAPRSADIRADLIMDLWSLVEASEEVDKESAFELICRLYDGISFAELSEATFDLLDYINFVALSYLGDFQKRNWLFWRVISRRIRHQRLKHQMIKLLGARPPELPLPPVLSPG